MTPKLRDDYSGSFDPSIGLADFSRRALAPLGREYLLHGHLQDRVGIPLVLSRHTRQDMLDVAIEEWMAASPLYSLRTQRALAFGNADVPTIFKNIQLDIGAPHQFMDFQYKVDDAQHGEFWLDHCGALMDVEPMGEEFVFGMCHDIEDPTFDATAGATNPHAQVRPIHRPPRTPADRSPHCHWRVVIDPDGEPVEPHPTMAVGREVEIARSVSTIPPMTGTRRVVRLLRRLRSRLHARGPLAPRTRRGVAGSRGANASPGARVPALRREPLGCRRGGRERAAGVHRSCRRRSRSAPGRVGNPRRRRRSRRQAPAGPSRVPPRTYVAPSIELIDERAVRFALRDAPCFHEHDGLSWVSSMNDEPNPALDAIAHAINLRAYTAPVAPRDGERLAWLITIDPDAEPARPSPSVELARISTGATVKFLPRRDLRN